MRSADGLLGTIDRLYAASREPRDWLPALEAVTDLLGAGHTILIAGNPADAGFALGARVHQADVDRLVWSGSTALQGALDFGRLPAGTLVARHSVAPDEEFVRTEYYNEVVRPLNGFHSFFFRQPTCEGGVALAICRPPEVEDFGVEEIVTLKALLPHVVNAVELGERIRVVERYSSSLEHVLDRVATGVILTDAAARPRMINVRAARILGEADGLVVEAGSLACGSRRATRMLREAIAAAGAPPTVRDHSLNAAAVPGPLANMRLHLERPSFRPPLLVSIHPLWSLAPTVAGTGQARVAVFVDEPDAPVLIDSLALAEAFALTCREAQIAGLVGEGHDLPAIAKRLSLGIGTIRNHLKRVFEKTGTHSQAALVALARGFAETRTDT